MLVEFIWLNIEPPTFMGYMAANAIKQIAIIARNNTPSPSILLYDCYDFSNHVKDICFECVF